MPGLNLNEYKVKPVCENGTFIYCNLFYRETVTFRLGNIRRSYLLLIRFKPPKMDFIPLPRDSNLEETVNIHIKFILPSFVEKLRLDENIVIDIQ